MKKWKILNIITTLTQFACWTIFVIAAWCALWAVDYNLTTFQSTYAGQKVQGIPIEVLVSMLYIITVIVFIVILFCYPVAIIYRCQTENRTTEKFLNMTLAVKIQEEFNERYPDYKGYLKAHIQKNRDNNYTQHTVELTMKDTIIIKEYVMIPEEDELYDRGMAFWNGLPETFDKMIKEFERKHTADK